jgi:16S rRNA (guanine527-N7)-methyltransferase
VTSLVEVLEESRRFGFLGPGPIDAHIRHAGAFASAIPTPPALGLDLGAGGGLPGLVLAATTWPSTSWVFVDAQLKRTAFLEQAVQDLGLDGRVVVVTERAEVVGRDPGHRGRYDLVTARSFGAPAVVAECAAPLLVVGGWLVVSEPPGGDVTDRWPADGLALVGLGPAEAVGDDDVHLARMAQVAPVPDRYPRRVGIPAKRPLF